jgi:site-specific DNA-methyltransferase (adenine-specific)
VKVYPYLAKHQGTRLDLIYFLSWRALLKREGFRMLFHDDCLKVLSTLEGSCIDLVYLDPPFFTQKIHTQTNRDGEQHEFSDKWENLETYKDYMKIRLSECFRVLKDTGSIFLHCARTASHHLRVILDEVFNPDNFRSEIVWSYRRWSNSKKGLQNNHQIILFYSKTDNYTFNTEYVDYSPTTNIDQIFQRRIRDDRGKTVYKSDDTGNYELVEEKHGVPLSDVWEIPYLNPKAKERVGYPTQKPVQLLERIIRIASNVGDTVLDPFCGSGTTLVAASRLNREAIGIDVAVEAINLANARLRDPIVSESALLNKGIAAYRNQSFEILETLRKIDAEPVQRNKGIDGFLRIKGTMRPIPVRIQRDNEKIEVTISSLEKAVSRNGYKQAIIVKTNEHSGEQLFDPPIITKNGFFIAEDLSKIESIRYELMEKETLAQ